MSAITNSPFSSSSMDVVNLEVKGKKSGGGKGSEGSEGSRGNRPDTKRNLEPNKPTPAPFIPIIWEIKPKKEASGETAGMNAGKSLTSETDESAAVRRVLSWKNPAIHDAYAAKARGSSSSGKFGPVTYDGGKCVARGSGSEGGFKDPAVYSTGGSASSCSIS